MAKGRWEQLIEEFGQPAYKDTTKDEGLTREVPAQTVSAELKATPGEPDTTEEDPFCAEPCSAEDNEDLDWAGFGI